MLKELIESGFGEEQDYNCAEKILYGANIAYNLDLSTESMKLAAGFGGGLAIGDICGAICGAVMVLSHLHVNSVAHESPSLKPEIKQFIAQYQAEMGMTHCLELKERYRTPEKKCFYVLLKAAELLDKQVKDIIK